MPAIAERIRKEFGCEPLGSTPEEQMRAAEEAAFASGVQVEALMNKAGTGVAQAVTKFFRNPGSCIVFAG